MRSSNTNNAKENSAAFLLSASFLKRTLTALILIPLGLWILMLGYPYSAGLFLLLFIGLLVEWMLLIHKSRFSIISKLLWGLGGALYITTGLGGLYHAHNQRPVFFIVLLFVIWGTDIGAYFIGQLVGGPKLWPRVSPKKTWSGAIGGTLAALLMTFIASRLDGFRNIALFGIFVGLSIVGQIGDLIESAVKRHFDVKDSGTLLPGHGGLLDRFDSTLAIGVFLWVCYILSLG
jgi:phosphatidate cytidylyltransferase